MGVGAKGEAGIGVAEVVGKLLDRDTLRQQNRGIEVAESMHSISTLAVVEASCNETLLNRSPLRMRPPSSAITRVASCGSPSTSCQGNVIDVGRYVWT